MTRSGRVFALKYTPKVVPMPLAILVPSPQAGASDCVPTIPVRAPISSMPKGTSSSSAKATTSRGEEVINEKDLAKIIIATTEGWEFLKLIKKVISRLSTTWVKLH